MIGIKTKCVAYPVSLFFWFYFFPPSGPGETHNVYELHLLRDNNVLQRLKESSHLHSLALTQIFQTQSQYYELNISFESVLNSIYRVATLRI